MKPTIFKLLCLSLLLCPACSLPQVDFSWLPSLPHPGSAKTALLSADVARPPAKRVVDACVAAYEQLHTYTVVVIKQERVHQEPLHPAETIFMKFRKPNQIYMKWIKEPSKGMELIYPVQGNKMVVEPGGLLDLITPRLHLHPTDKLATLNRRHPLHESTLGNFVYQYAQDFSRALAKNECQLFYENPSWVGEVPAERVEIILPDTPASGYYCYRSVVWFDLATHLPVQIEFYDWNNEVFERYRFRELKVNPTLTDKDFDENNPEYDF